METSFTQHPIQRCFKRKSGTDSTPMVDSAAKRCAWSMSAIALWFVATGGVELPASQTSPDQPKIASKTNSVPSQRGYYVVEYTTEPDPIPLNEMFAMRVEVRERHKQSLATRVSLEVDAGMLAHNHGMNTRPKVEPGVDGSFRVRGMLFHMPGEWHMTFLVKRGIVTDKAITDVVLR